MTCMPIQILRLARQCMGLMTPRLAISGARSIVHPMFELLCQKGLSVQPNSTKFACKLILVGQAKLSKGAGTGLNQLNSFELHWAFNIKLGLCLIW